MREFLTNNLDYIFFVYGLAFLLLAAFCLPGGRKAPSQVPWLFLAVFGLTHGLNEWLDMSVLILGSTPAVDWVRWALMVASFIALLEFGRQGLQRTGIMWPGRWIFLPLIALVATGSFFGLPGLNSTSRYVLGLLGGLLAALTLYRLSREEVECRRSLVVSAWAMAIYGIAAGLIVRGTGTSLDMGFTQESFLRVTGVPIQLVRAFLAVIISISLWEYHSNKGLRSLERFDQTARRKAAKWMNATIVLLITMGWISTAESGRMGRTFDRFHHDTETNRIEDFLVGPIDTARHLAVLAANVPPSVELMTQKTQSDTQKSNRALDNLSKLIPGSIVYLLDPTGLTIASSNRSKPDSFVGKNYAVRPYFRMAHDGQSGHYFAVGLTSGEPGYYASQPIFDARKSVLGVAVVKISLSSLRFLAGTGERTFFVSPEGVVLLSSEKSLALRAMWPIDPAVAKAMIDAKQVPTIDQTPLLDRIPEDVAQLRANGVLVSVARRVTPLDGWSVVHWNTHPTSPWFRLLSIAVCLLLTAFVLVFYMIRRKEQEVKETIAESELRYRAMFENNAAVKMLLDATSGDILDANTAACQFYGYSREELLHMRIFDINTAPPEEVMGALRHIVATKSARFEFRHRIRSGDIRDIEVHSTYLTHLGQDRVYNIIHDIGDQKRAEREKEQVKAQLIHSAKLASIGTLAAGVAHEINNPLAIIHGYLSILSQRLTGIPNEAEVQVILKKQLNATERIKSIVNGMRTYARADTDHIEPVDVHKVVSDTLMFVDQLIRKADIELKLNLQSSNPMIVGNFGKLQQIVVNLVNNACDALESRRTARIIEIETVDQDSFLLLQIRDNGPGIPTHVIERVFDPFFTTKPPGKGTGLGLSISRSIVESFAGRIEIVSNPDQGCAFRIYLPHASVSPAPQTNVERAEIDLTQLGRNKSAIVIEDESDLRLIVVGFLESFGFAVSASDSAERAADLLKNNTVDLICTDLKLPGMDGIAFMRIAKEVPANSKTKFIAMTGGIITDSPAQDRKDLRHLADGYLLKPFSKEQLAVMISGFWK